MRIPPILIVADRGTLKLYQVDHTSHHGPAPHLISTFRVEEAHSRYQDRFTDMAGAFPVGGGNGQATAISERMSLEIENEQRIFRQLGTLINTFLGEHKPARWGFAASPDINSSILDSVTIEYRKKIALNVSRDLVNIDHAHLLRHFEE